MEQRTQEEILNKLNELKTDYETDKISFFIEINDDHTNQILQTKNYDTIEECLTLWNEIITFQDNDTDVWLMYEVEDSDIDRFADIKLCKNGNYGLIW